MLRPYSVVIAGVFADFALSIGRRIIHRMQVFRVFPRSDSPLLLIANSKYGINGRAHSLNEAVMEDRPLTDLNEAHPREPGADMRTCEVCGQRYDHNHLGQMYHHEMSGPHEPWP